ncbi:CREB-regulated transcription coactivator 1-like isoform X3 [Dreissena polymorpha]|uniref:CREB-regulated transcription coactivator 1-like isoform X3 n=1 Tax=Dreissena polymorpha TaxID=45954 RepID=UPI002264E1EE|nr:CREB-regulated transcription coactivator 1-like isoform X3 [Dreissena polymorpha]
MANPRKFSEKIALHNQKQAEETAAFEAILRDVSAATRGHPKPQPNQQLHIQQNIIQQYRGGSLPNVNQMSNSNSGIDLQVLQHMEAMRGGSQARVDRIHPRDRGRQGGPLRSRPFNMEKTRADCSPYGSGAYLSPPPDTSWRRPVPIPRFYRHLNGVNHLSRTNSDSAIHSSSLGGPLGMDPSPNTPPMHRRIHEVVGENSGLSAGPYPWDPKKMDEFDDFHQNYQLQQRPKSCEVPNINIYPSAEQELQVHIPISSNTGSLPDLTNIQFPSPLQTPLDLEEQQANYANSVANLSPTSAHHMTMGPPTHHNGSPSQSPGSQRRRMNHSGPSPLVLQQNGNQSMRVPLSPPRGRRTVYVQNHDLSSLHVDPRTQAQYMLYMRLQQQQQHQQQHQQQGPGGAQHSPTHTPHGPVLGGLMGHNDSPRVPPPHLGPLPKVCVTSHENDSPEVNMSQYRNNISDGGACQSPTSPHSQSSYSPSQSPGIPPGSSWHNNIFDDSYHLQQQQTNALQQQFEHFNMQHQPISTSSSIAQGSNGGMIVSSASSSQPYSQANNSGMADYNQANSLQYYMENNFSLSLTHMNNTITSSTAGTKIPDIVFSGMGDGSFDADLFGSVSDEALKDGLVPLDLDGLQMLTDPSMITDPDTENSFKLDQL